MQELELIQDDELELVSGGNGGLVVNLNLNTMNNFQRADLDVTRGGTIVIGGAFTAAQFS